MAQYLPIRLSGDNLGERHRHLNSQVVQASKNLTSFQDICHSSEQTPIDRLFKIDLAIKLKNIDYILKNLKDDDMLFVSRALKCKWLMEQRDVINPEYLEEVLFPGMVMPAISKMKHWLYINMRDTLMCKQFYQYYKEANFDYAVKFLSHCNDDFVFREFCKILRKLTPHHLKVFAEKWPKLVKIYFDALATDDELVKQYLKEEQKFYSSIKCVLKSKPNIFLDITEKYYNLRVSKKFSPSATKYILTFHKHRVMTKPELYIVYILHSQTVVRRLSAEECQDIVLKFARAEYLGSWFNYGNVEPFIKRVKREKRAAFKMQVFMVKIDGERLRECPYVLPSSPVVKHTSSDKSHVFHDDKFEPIKTAVPQSMDRRLSGSPIELSAWSHISRYCLVKSELDKLFDEFRYTGFERTLHSLSARVNAAKSADRRRDMLLVLVSKSGGRDDAVRSLLNLALRLRNEPVHERAAVVRSLVRRAHAWRLPQITWDMMLEYARGLGLDGSDSDAECWEGLHAVVLRQLLATGDCESPVRTAFLNKFSTLSEYKLVVSERVKITAGLQHLLVTAVKEDEPVEAALRVGQLLDVLEKYHVSIKSSPAVSIVAALAERDLNAAEPLLARLYSARVGRRELFHYVLEFRRDDAALLNILRHDHTVITPEWFVKLLANGETCLNHFFSKLAVYFKETGGLAEKIQYLLQEQVAHKPQFKLVRPLAMLFGNDIQLFWRQYDMAGGEHSKLAAALRANMHHARPAPDAIALGWRTAGMKAVAWRAMRCRPAQVTRLVQTLLEERSKRPVRLALVLAQRTDAVADMFTIAVTIRPLAALRSALLYFRKFGDAAHPRVWDLVKSLISSADLVPPAGLRYILRQVHWVPNAIKPNYCAILYLALSKISDDNANCVLSALMTCLTEVNEELLENVMLRMVENLDKQNPESYPAIIIRYLMLSKNNDELNIRLAKIGDIFLTKLLSFRAKKESRRYNFFQKNLKQIIHSLQYNYACFDMKYQCCLPVIKWVLCWIEKFRPKDIYFKEYVTIYAMILYYKAVRESMIQSPKVFDDPVRKMSEGVDIVGFTFGRYVAKEVFDLKAQYFDSIIDIYKDGFIDYLNEKFMHSSYRKELITAIIKGILSENERGEARLVIHILRSQYMTRSEEVDELLMKNEDKETQFFLYAYED